jgi:hypothetical protein
VWKKYLPSVHPAKTSTALALQFVLRSRLQAAPAAATDFATVEQRCAPASGTAAQKRPGNRARKNKQGK